MHRLEAGEHGQLRRSCRLSEGSRRWLDGLVHYHRLARGSCVGLRPELPEKAVEQPNSPLPPPVFRRIEAGSAAAAATLHGRIR